MGVMLRFDWMDALLLKSKAMLMGVLLVSVRGKGELVMLTEAWFNVGEPVHVAPAAQELEPMETDPAVPFLMVKLWLLKVICMPEYVPAGVL